MPQNVELKARLASLDRAAQAARELGAVDHGLLHQVDTYFVAQTGRLKLREINGERAELIWYARADDSDAKLSNYVVSPTPDPQSLRQCLESAWGVETAVTKRRHLWIYQNVRIHLDRVEQLGEFLEFEAVLGEGHSEEEGRQLVAQLRRVFAIADDVLVTGSYRELMLAQR